MFGHAVVTLIVFCINVAQGHTRYYWICKHCRLQFYESNTYCQDLEPGRSLASIDSTQHNDLLSKWCGESNNNCWIGLTITRHNTSIYPVYAWTDGTNPDIQFINKSLCTNMNLNATHLFGYMNVNKNCWELTSNSSLKFQVTCGPQRVDTTGYFWICHTILPCVISIITVSYSIYCIIFLMRHLFVLDHPYVDDRLIPSLSIQITAILMAILVNVISVLFCVYSIMLYTSYQETELFPPTQLLDPYYPYIYTETGIIGITVLSLYLINIPIGYTHVFLRLKHAFNKNSIMGTAISSKYIYPVISILIICFALLPPIYEIINAHIGWAPDEELLIKIILIVLEFVLDITINSLLLYLYVKALHIFAIKQYFNYDITKDNLHGNVKLIDDRQHELMLEAARYTVLFSSVLLFNIFVITGGIITYFVAEQEIYSNSNHQYVAHNGDTFENISMAMLIVAINGKELLLLMAIKLSFIFSHSDYERVCKKCDQYVKDCCHKLAKKRNANVVKEHDLKQCLLNSSENMIQMHQSQ